MGDTDRLATWWARLSDSQRLETYGLGARSPMPNWMVRSLQDAHVPGLVEIARPEGVVSAWFLMPGPVAQLVARCRRGEHDL